MKLSFKKRIATYNLVAISAITVIAFVLIYTVVYYTSYQHLDSDITAEKQEVFSNLDWKGDRIIINKMPEWEEAEHKQIEVNPTFIQIVDINGKTVFKSVNLQDNYFLFNPKISTSTFYNTTINGQRIRQGQFPILNEANKIIGQLSIGVSQQESYNVLRNLLVALCLTYIIILSILYFIMIYVASKAIAPVNDLIESASAINYTNLNDRLPLPEYNDEIHQLATTFNELLARLETNFLQQKQFVSDVSHEMQTPLAGLKGTIEVLLRKDRTPEYYQEKLRQMVSQTDRMSLLFNQMLRLSLAEAGTLPIERKSINLFTILQEIATVHREQIALKNISFLNSVPTDTLITGDVVLVESILENFLSNAVKYNRHNGTIICRWDAAIYTLFITDEGKGIDEAHLPFLFDRFYRVDDSRNSQVPGAGLGLSIAKRLCDLQGISISVQSTVDVGTTITLQFPI